MDHDYGQRRRVALAIAITVIAGPAAFLLNRSSDEPAATTVAPNVITAAVPTLPGQTTPPAAGSDAAVTDALGTAPIGYLTGSTLPPNQEPAQIAIPQLPAFVKGEATFSSVIDSTMRCQARTADGIPFNATLTVTNLDNSRSVQCVASIGGAQPKSTIVLATDTFAEIADLTDAPIPVQITWDQ